MSQPTTYVRAFNFTNQQAVTPSDPLPADKVDLEFNLVKTSLDETQANLAQIQRDDGAVKNSSIGFDQLKPELNGFGFNPPEPWATATNYIARDTVFEDAGFYQCVTSHISGVFATDLAAGKWLLVADFTAATAEAAAHAAAALASENAAAASVVLTNADVVLTGADVDTTAANVALTNADVALTGADVLLTHADVVLTGADVALTSANAALTDADAIATAADRVQTGLDRVQTGLDRTAAAASAASVDVTSMDWRPNLIVNGSMIVSQENGNTLGTTNGYFAADQFGLYFTAATAAMSIQRVQSSKSLAGAANKLEYKCTAAKASLGASDFLMISQPIEGSRPDFVAAGWGAAGAKQFVYRHEMSLPAGLYHLHVQNSAGNRHIAVPFTVAGGDANVAKVHEIVVPGDTAGTWLTADGTIGAVFDVVLAAGATLTNAAGAAWGGTTYYAAATQFNILSSTANVARLADVGLKLDPDATGVYGAYEVGEVDAKFRAERYLRQFFGGVSGFANGAAAVDVGFVYSNMCKAPTIAATAALATVDSPAASPTQSSASVSSPTSSRDGSTIRLSNLSGLTSGQGITVRANSSAIANLNARLS